ncbi:MAG: DUF6603 domain-containing protein [Candidatus Methanoperedens sp.]
MITNNFTETALLEVSYLLSPVKSLSSAEMVVSFFGKLGYTLPQANVLPVLSTLVSEIDGVILGAKDLVNADTDEEKETAITALVLKIGSAFTEINNLVTAINALADYSTAGNPPLSELPKRVVDYLIFQYLYQRQPRIFGTLFLLGILNDDNGQFVIYWDKIPRYFTEPAVVFDEIYKWNTAFDTDLFLTRFQLFLKAMGIAGGIYEQSATVKNALGNATAGLPELRIPVLQKGYYPELYAQLGLNLSPAEAKANAKKGLALIPYFLGTSQFEFEINPKWLTTFSSTLVLDAGVGLVIRPPLNLEVFEKIFLAPLSASSFELDLTAKQKKDQNNQIPEIYLFGSKSSTHLSIKGIALKLFVDSIASGQDIGLDIDIETISLLIGGGQGDSFLTKLLPKDGIGASFGLGLGFSLAKKFYFKGSSGIEILLPIHLQLGPINIQNIIIGVKIENKKIPLEVGADVKGELGPLTIVIQNIGLRTELLFSDSGGKLGPLDVHLGFKPPSAIGLSLDTSAVKAGGFLQIKPDEYIGALELEIKAIKLAIKAIAIINTKLPGEQQGFSLLVIITAEFSPITLVFGFTLNGLGGLFGYKREFNRDELRLGLKTKALDSILFPKNVIANITKIVSDLKNVFPIGNNFLIGPMVKIGWGASLVTAEIGILIQIPEPIIIAILGVIRLQLPDPKDAILKLQINFLGIIDFEKKMLSLDSSLTDSRILTMTLTGEFAVRLGWGFPPVFIFSSGGFHPDFKEAPVELQHMERLGLQIINEEEVKLGVNTYFALTTNTVQIGAHARFWAKSGSYTAQAEVGFDALIQFKPFFFSIAIFLTGRVTGPMIDVVIEVKGNLSGPNPWHTWGFAHAKVLFFEITIPFNKTFGDPIEELSAGIENVLKLLIEEIPKNTNWKTTTVINGISKVSLREITPDPDNMIVHPNTVLSFNQRVVPLEVAIHNFGNKGVDEPKKFSITAQATVSDTKLYDSFAPGNFFEIGKDQKLSRPSFEQMKSGIEFTIGSSSAAGIAVLKDIDYEVIYIRNKKIAEKKEISLLNPYQVVLLASGGAAAKSKLSVENTRVSYQAPPKITINRPRYIVAKKADLSEVVTEEFGNQAEAYNKRLEFDENETLILSTQEI